MFELKQIPNGPPRAVILQCTVLSSSAVLSSNSNLTEFTKIKNSTSRLPNSVSESFVTHSKALGPTQYAVAKGDCALFGTDEILATYVDKNATPIQENELCSSLWKSCDASSSWTCAHQCFCNARASVNTSGSFSRCSTASTIDSN